VPGKPAIHAIAVFRMFRVFRIRREVAVEGVGEVRLHVPLARRGPLVITLTGGGGAAARTSLMVVLPVPSAQMTMFFTGVPSPVPRSAMSLERGSLSCQHDSCPYCAYGSPWPSEGQRAGKRGY